MAEGLSKAARRIKREIKEITEGKDASSSLISVEMVKDNLLDLKGEISGPPDTPYEGGKFKLEIKVPETYPFKPFKVRFITRIWHPNVSSVTGTICLNILKEDWVPCISLRTVLISLQGLLCSAEPNSPQDAVVAKQFIGNPEMFKLTAKYWTQFYAGAPGTKHPEFEAKIKRLMDTGVSEESILSALSSRLWNLEQAMDLIFD